MEGGVWLKQHAEHLLVLSSAGKPVFSMHDFQDSDGGLAICSLLCALAAKTQDKLFTVQAAKFQLLFKYRGDLLLVAISRSSNTTLLLCAQLDLLYSHILFHVTLPALNHLFRNNASYDLSNLLGGTDAHARALITMSRTELGLLLKSQPVLPLLSAYTRSELIQKLEACRVKSKSTFALLLAAQGQQHAVSVCTLGPPPPPQGKRGAANYTSMLAHTSAMDFFLLSNYVLRGPAAVQQTQMMETWTPLCLPDFNNSGHFHCYSASVRDGVYLVLCTTDPSLEQFHLASESKARFCTSVSENCWQALEHDLRREATPLDLFSSWEALHVAVRYCGQVVQSNRFGLKMIPMAAENPRSDYLMQRYEQVAPARGGGNSSSEQVRLVFDAQMRDLAVYCRERDLEIYALFPPLTTPTMVQEELKLIGDAVLQNKLALFALPEQI